MFISVYILWYDTQKKDQHDLKALIHVYTYYLLFLQPSSQVSYCDRSLSVVCASVVGKRLL